MNCHASLLVNVRKLTMTYNIISLLTQLFRSLLPYYLYTVVRAATTACCFCFYFSSHSFLVLSFHQYLLYFKLSKQ